MNTTIQRALEIRTAALGPFEFRAVSDGIGQLVGYAAKYNRYSQNLGGFVEMVDPAAFRRSLADEVPVMCRYNHEDDCLLGTTEAKTLTLTDDAEGLAYAVSLPDTGAGRDVKALALRGDVRYSSFAFWTIEDEWSVTDQGFPLRILKQIRLIDVAPVNDPAYRDTSVAVRSLGERIGLDHDEVMRLDLDERRTRLVTGQAPVIPPESSGEQVDEEQRDTHSPLALYRARLDLEAKR